MITPEQDRTSIVVFPRKKLKGAVDGSDTIRYNILIKIAADLFFKDKYIIEK